MSKIMCMSCEKILESKNRHDFNMCNCENETFVDGGNDYMRIGGKDLNLIYYWDKIEQIFKPVIE